MKCGPRHSFPFWGPSDLHQGICPVLEQCNLSVGPGNLGSQLVEYKEEMYITSDCGHTWRQVRCQWYLVFVNSQGSLCSMPLLSWELSRVLSKMSSPDYQPQKQPRPLLRARTYGDGASRGWGHLPNALWLLLGIIHPRSTSQPDVSPGTSREGD